MRNIERIRNRYERYIVKKRCGLESISKCEKSFCSCAKLAEIRAYQEAVIPNGYEQLSIFNFQGFSKSNKRILNNNVVAKAKNRLCQYCWGKSWKEVVDGYKTEEEQKEFMRNNSVLPSRLQGSHNVVIYGDSNKPSGRTLSASIIMDEAIKLRLKKGNRGQTYDWIDFCVLVNELCSNNPTVDIDEIRHCDWLVIDNITITETVSYSQHYLYSNVINTFLLPRLSSYVTILVIKDNIDKKDNLEESFGLGITSAIQNNNTTLIPLC
jgi:DNA replication protein DnaC